MSLTGSLTRPLVSSVTSSLLGGDESGPSISLSAPDFGGGTYYEGVDDDDITVSISNFEPSTSYTISVSSSGGGTPPANATGTTDGDGAASAVMNITGLNAGTVTFTATVGSDVRTRIVTLAAASAPSAPQNLAVTPGDTQNVLVWRVPASQNGAVITDYFIEVDSGGGFSTIADGTNTNLTYTHTGLTNGTEYTYRVSATNSVGTGSPSATASGTPIAVPAQVGTVTPTAGDGQISQSWSAPSDGGSEITDYRIQRSLDGSTGWVTLSDGTSTTTSVTDTGLSDGTEYFYRVAAINANGVGPYSAVVSETTDDVPAQVGTVTPSGGNGQVVLSWSAPSNNGSSITDYVIQYKLSSSGTWLTFADGANASTGATVTSLTNASAYDFRVAAVNGIGQGVYSATVSSTPTEAATLPQANLIGDWRFDEGSGGGVINHAAASVPSSISNLNPFPEDNFELGGYWKSNGTASATDVGATDPFSGSRASQLVIGSGSQFNGLLARDKTLASGVEYTLSCYVKSNTGADQTFRLAADIFQRSDDYTATSTWQRFQWTVTTTSTRSAGFVNGTDALAKDLLIFGLWWEQTSSASTYERPAGHFVPHSTATAVPSWVTGGLEFDSANNEALAGSLLNSFDPVAGTAHVAFSKPGVVAEENTYNPLVETGYDNSTNAMRVNLSQNTFLPEANVGSNTTPTKTDTNSHQALMQDGTGVNIYSVSWGGGAFTEYMNGVKIFEQSSGFTPSTNLEDLLSLGTFRSVQFLDGQLYYAALYDSKQSDADVFQAQEYIINTVGARGLTVPSIGAPDTNLIVFEGDSITSAGNGPPGYHAFLLEDLGFGHTGVLAARIGDTIVVANSRSSLLTAIYGATHSSNTVVCMLGANDLNSSGSDVDTILSDFKAYAQARQTEGWNVVWMTPSTSDRGGNTNVGGFEVQRADMITKIKRDPSWYDGLVNIGDTAELGDFAQVGGVYIPGGTHWSTAGHKAAATYITPVVQGVLAGHTKPGAPTGLSATAGTGEVTLSWTAPASDGGSAITDYYVWYSDDSGVSWSRFEDAVSATTGATVTGLTGSTEYTFEVQAVNAVSPGDLSGQDTATPS